MINRGEVSRVDRWDEKPGSIRYLCQVVRLWDYNKGDLVIVLIVLVIGWRLQRLTKIVWWTIIIAQLSSQRRGRTGAVYWSQWATNIVSFDQEIAGPRRNRKSQRKNRERKRVPRQLCFTDRTKGVRNAQYKWEESWA